MVRIHLVNVNDESPVFKEFSYNFEMREGNAVGDVIGKVFATDNDNLQPVVYALKNSTLGKVRSSDI